ncbi:MAG: ATP-binding cassette domain-containing protein, partial [Arenicella sp.]|nr:ATP-binding cassette domain-containing protein [Arenicella sp.]
ERLGLADRIGHLPRQLSGGEQQRVALCRAFAVQPKILFADEPTANLDTLTAETVLDQLFSLQRELNTSMVIATHDRALALRCDRVLQLQSGRLVAEV